MTPAELQRLTEEIAVDSSWSLIDSTSTDEVETVADGAIEWKAVGDEYAGPALEDAIRFLEAMKLLERHATKPNWVREIAEL